MSITGARKATIYDPATGTAVQLNTLSQDSELTVSGNGEKDSGGSAKYTGDESSMTLVSYDLANIAQLKTWEKARTPLNAVVHGLQDNGLWYEDTTITVSKPFSFSPKGRNMATIQFNRSGGEHNIETGVNLVVAGGGKADPFEIAYPVSSVTLTLALDATSTGTVTITALDYSNTTLASASITLAVGPRQSTTITLPANTYSVKITGLTNASNVSLRGDNSTEYTTE